MAMIPGRLNMDEQGSMLFLQEAMEKLDNTDGEVVLDFSSVGRIDSAVLRALEEFVSAAEGKGVKVVLCRVNVSVYKVLKLTKLAPRFTFTS
jgi:anti-anti-sigma factor